MCVYVWGVDWLCYDTCTLTSVDRGGYEVTARRRCVGSNTLLFRIRVVSDTDLGPSAVYPELVYFFFILDGFSNIKYFRLG